MTSSGTNPGTNIVLQHVPGQLRAKTAELRDDLRAEGVIEAPRNIYNYADGGCFPSRGLSTDERAAIDAYLAAKAPRRYPFADTGDDFNICVFLRSKGYNVQRNCSIGSKRAPFFINEKSYTRKGFVAFVNRVRATLNLMPLGVPA